MNKSFNGRFEHSKRTTPDRRKRQKKRLKIEEGEENDFHLHDSQETEIIIDPHPTSIRTRASYFSRYVDQAVADFPPDDAQLLKEFSARHAGFLLLDQQILPPDVRSEPYVFFAKFLKDLRSHSTLDLITTLKSSVSADLDVVKGYGFSGKWLDELELRLNHQTYGISDKDLKILTEHEVTQLERIRDLEECKVLKDKLAELENKLSAGNQTMEYLSNKTKKIMAGKARLNAPFRF